jgi:hypothetical protein
MNEQVPPDSLSTQQENELICEKLLGLKKHCDRPDCHDWRTADGNRYWNNPSFTTWADAGLILDALNNVVGWEPARARSNLGWLLKTGELTPFAVRAEALEYIRRQP